MVLVERIQVTLSNIAYVIAQAPLGVRFLFGYGLGRLLGRPKSKLIESLTESVILGKPFTEAEKAYFSALVSEMKLSPWALPISFFRLPARLERKLLKGSVLLSLHQARMTAIRECLPPADTILDLGGASDIDPEGALLAMGYPHKPHHIYIVDRADEQRKYYTALHSRSDLTARCGAQIHYVFSDMGDLSRFPENYFELVWSGQSIEHVSEKAADEIFKSIARVLRPGGAFCLDTPNRAVTRLMSHDYCHPEHQIEYLPEQLASKIEKSGLTILRLLAVTPVAISIRVDRLSKLELMKETRVSDDYNEGVSFFIHAQKPCTET